MIKKEREVEEKKKGYKKKIKYLRGIGHGSIY